MEVEWLAHPNKGLVNTGLFFDMRYCIVGLLENAGDNYYQ